MTHFEKIKQDFQDNGFTIDGDFFIKETVTYSSIIINGREIQQPQSQIFKMKYIGEGSMKNTNTQDDSDFDPKEIEISEFDILAENDEMVVTICVENFNDFSFLMSGGRS